MSDFSFLAVPNIEGMRLWWYIQIFGSVVLFGLSLFFVIYFWLIYRKKHHVFHQLAIFDRQAQELQQQLFHHKIQKATGKTKLILFIEYLERFVTSTSYANVSELLFLQGFTSPEVENIEHVLYADWLLSSIVETKIDKYVMTKIDKK